MLLRRFALVAAIVVAGVVMSGAWMVAHRGDHPLFDRIVVAAGDDPSDVPINIEGASLIEIDRTGALLVHVGDRVTRQPRPRAYQEISGARREVSVHFEFAPAGNPRFAIGPYDHGLPLVIE